MSNRRGGALVKVLIGILASVTILVMCVLGVAFYLAHNSQVTKSRGKTVVETPFGRVAVRERRGPDPAHLGVPIYPGAVRDTGGRKLVGIELDIGNTHKEFNIAAGGYMTGDPPKQVMEFYKQQLPHWILHRKCLTEWELSMTESGYKRIVGIKEHGKQTYITLASVGEPASN